MLTRKKVLKCFVMLLPASRIAELHISNIFCVVESLYVGRRPRKKTRAFILVGFFQACPGAKAPKIPLDCLIGLRSWEKRKIWKSFFPADLLWSKSHRLLALVRKESVDDFVFLHVVNHQRKKNPDFLLVIYAKLWLNLFCIPKQFVRWV